MDTELATTEQRQWHRRFGEFLADVVHASREPTKMTTSMRACQAKILAAAGLNEGNPPDGGYLVDTEHTLRLLNRTYRVSRLADLCNRITLMTGANVVRLPTTDESSRVTGSRLGGVRIYREQEAEEVESSIPRFKSFTIQLEKMIALCPVSNDLLQDVPVLGQVVGDLFAQEFAFQLDDEILNGSGAGRCLGILEAPGTITVEKESGQTAKTISTENVNEMDAAFWEGPEDNGVWIANRDTKPELRKLGDDGKPLFVETVGANGKPRPTLCGRRILFPEQSPTLGARGDLMLVDLSEYLLVDRELSPALSIHTQFMIDESAFRFVYRVNGQPAWSAPMTPYHGAAGAEVSPFVILGARA